MEEITSTIREQAIRFKALGDPTRLHIYRFLCACCVPVAIGDEGEVRPLVGPTVGEVCCHITGEERITSTISHHLRELRLAGLITQERRGKHILCRIDPAAAAEIASFFNDKLKGATTNECCK